MNPTAIFMIELMNLIICMIIMIPTYVRISNNFRVEFVHIFLFTWIT